MSAPQRTRRRVAQQPQLVPQEDPPAAAAEDDLPAAAAEDQRKDKSPKRTRKGRGKKTNDEEDFNAGSGVEHESGSDDDESPKKKVKPTTTAKPKGGKKKNTGEKEAPAKVPKAPAKTPAKRGTTAAAKPVAKAGPAVSAHVNIASDARAAKWHADLDLALAHRKIATEEAKADFYLTATELGGRLIGLVDLHAVDTLATLRSKGVLGKTQTLPRFELPPPPDAPPLPGPFESIWLLGKILRSPLEVSGPPVEGSGAEAGPSTAGAATTSTMLVGTPALVEDETPGSPTQSREEEDEG